MQSWRWRFGCDVVGRSIALDLVDAVKRHVEAIAGFVLDDRDFDGALAYIDLLDAAIDTHTVLEVNYVIARLERSQTLECGTSRIPSRAAEASLAAEDLVIRKYAISGKISVTRRNDEPAVEDADHKARRRHPVVVQQFVESLGLTGVVAQNHRRDSVGDDLLQSLDVAADFFRTAKRKLRRR